MNRVLLYVLKTDIIFLTGKGFGKRVKQKNQISRREDLLFFSNDPEAIRKKVSEYKGELLNEIFTS